MSTRNYKRGAEDALNAINSWVGKMSSTTDFAIKEIQDILIKAKACGDNIEKLYEYISENERKAFYKIAPSYDIRELEKEEKYVLVGVLYQLAIDKPNNSNQKKYIQQIQKYLNVKDNTTVIYLEVIGNIENLAVQKAMYQVVIEYLALQDGEFYDETELQTELLDCFNLNMKTKNEIEKSVELTLKIVGKNGIAEKYEVVDTEAAIKTKVAEENEKLLNAVKKLDNINLQLILECFYELYEENIDIITEEYKSKSRCQSAVESELRKQYNSISNIFNTYSANALDKKALNEIKDEIEPIFEEIKHLSQILMDITKNELFSEIIGIASIDEFKEILEQSLKEQLNDTYFSIKPFEHYSQMLEYESFSFEEGFLGHLTATWSCENFYDIDLYDSVQKIVDVYTKHANSIVCEKVAIPIKNKVEEIVLKVFPDIDLYKNT